MVGFVSHLLLQSSHCDSPAAAPSMPSRPNLAGERADYRSHFQPPTNLAQSLGNLAEAPAAHVFAGNFGTLSHEYFVRVAGRICGEHVCGRPVASLSGRNSQRSGSTVWLVEREPFRSVGRHTHLGHPRASEASPPYAGACPGSCQLCAGLELVQDCSGDVRLVETFRIYLAATARPVLARRPTIFRAMSCTSVSDFPRHGIGRLTTNMCASTNREWPTGFKLS